MTKLTEGRWSIEVTQDWIDVTSGLPTPDEHWTYTDKAGHDHLYDHGYPTLVVVVDESHHCSGVDPDEQCDIGWNWYYDEDDGEEYEQWEAHEPHDIVLKYHRECPICGETIKPRMDPPYTSKQIPGMRHVRLSGTQFDGNMRRTLNVHPRPQDMDQIAALFTERANDAAIDAFVATLPKPECVDISVSSA